ncbi:hypothetical protein OG949_38280 [Streptomyces scopuliridis]|uniref:molybdopterin dinucleotide binding domain-containing protein n=1 Tax=Streptomyces scopuliridis TaxID=452529 RepID=UPI002DD989DA|nr:molybdopterin dinucleotide binding domain-containing protein [Streptomyces scopuliridis]WSB38100.1 hypothetical protein OG949_38280 [Streptomyces scopuliridis]
MTIEFIGIAATRIPASQFDGGALSMAAKAGGREAVAPHPDDAAARAVRDGDLVRSFRDRGAVLAGAVLTEGVRPGVMRLPTGVWFDPYPNRTRTSRRCARMAPPTPSPPISPPRASPGAARAGTRWFRPRSTWATRPR